MPLLDPDDGYKTIGDGEHTKNRQRAHRRRRQQAESGGGGQWRLGPDLPAGRRQSLGQAHRRFSADARLRQRPVRRYKARQIRRHLVARRHRARRQRHHAASGDRGQFPLLRHGVRRAGAMHGGESPTPCCSRARACTARSAAPTPGISWRCRGRISNRGFVDPAPASNADIGRTIAQLMGLDVHDNGKLVGRVLAETLPSGALPDVIEPRRDVGACAKRPGHGT